MTFTTFTDTGLSNLAGAGLLSRATLQTRWQCSSHAFFQRAEADGLLVARRFGTRVGYRWDDVWAFEGGQPPEGLEEAYSDDLITPTQLARLCPLQPATLQRRAGAGEIPHRRIGRFIRFVPLEAQRWLESWS
ncbi:MULTISPECIES: helix-turn-helix domain-containing protein [unclassified Yoonia]|uniref:helix-turn-helix domain-containing protein n=1 Tax=unclassified Yoonia TaxID=2629118 RepID=UPI002AFF94F3|nr:MULTISPECIES: helix-turn-helix domain-containing protein [unclassified Yoonia]